MLATAVRTSLVPRRFARSLALSRRRFLFPRLFSPPRLDLPRLLSGSFPGSAALPSPPQRPRALTCCTSLSTAGGSRNLSGGCGCGSVSLAFESSVRQQATFVSFHPAPCTPGLCPSARVWTRPPSSITAAATPAPVGCG